MIRRRSWSVGVLLLLLVGGYSFSLAATGSQVDQAKVGLELASIEVMAWAEDKSHAFVLFYLPTCPACKSAAPILTKLVEELELEFASVNLANPDNADLARSLGIRYVPSLFHVRDGVIEPEPLVGNVGEEEFRKYFTNALSEQDVEVIDHE